MLDAQELEDAPAVRVVELLHPVGEVRRMRFTDEALEPGGRARERLL